MKRGEIYIADLDPTQGSETNKQRPVLIVGNDANNRASPTITVLPITSNVARVFPFEVAVAPEESGLSKPSKIQAQQIRTISKQRIRGTSCGMIQPDAAKPCRCGAQTAFGIDMSQSQPAYDFHRIKDSSMPNQSPSLARLLAGYALLCAGQLQAGAADTLTFDGRAKTPDGERQAQLLVHCQPAHNSLNLQLIVWGAYPDKQQFDYEAFEGPEPMAGNSKLTVLTVTGAHGKHELRTDIGGWYSAEVQGAFVFSTNEYSAIRKDLSDLADAMAQGESTLSWVQEGYADRRLKVEAGFLFDTAASKRLQETVAGCLAKVTKNNR